MSLEDLAKVIEGYLHTVHADSGMQANQGRFQTNVKYDINIRSMVFQGESMPRSTQMSTLQAKTFLRDQEPFNVVYELRISGTTTTDFERRGFCRVAVRVVSHRGIHIKTTCQARMLLHQGNK